MDPTTLALYSNLIDDLVAETGLDADFLKSDVDIRSVSSPRIAAAVNQARALLKKFKVANSDQADSRALLKFLTVNKSVRDWELVLESDDDKILLGELKRAIYEFWNPGGYPLVTNFGTILDEGRCGPGASVGSVGGDFYTKMYSSPLSTTSHFLYDEYRRYVSIDPSCQAAELQRYGDFSGYKVVSGSRLSFVPKNDSISRCICIEPTLNMFYQLGLGFHLERRLSNHFGLEMGSQQFKNRELARIGSVFDDLCTIDLESASDSLGLRMLREVLPRDFYDLLVRLRSPSADLPGIGTFALDMISTMGNGFTFPLQTMLFACVVKSCFRVHGIKPLYPRGNCHGNFGVFGDDIIVPRSIVGSVMRCLNILGFVVNQEKTFVEGPFRESCGADYFRGVNVRGVYVKKIDTLQSRFAVINQLNLFSTRTGILLRRTVQYLLGFTKWVPVPMWENDDAGLHVPYSIIKDSLKLSRRYQSILYTCYRPVAMRIRIGESALVLPRRAKPRKWNPHGLHLCFLRHAVNSMTIGVRHDPVRYRTSRCIAPQWDNVITTHPLQGWFPWKRCESAFYLNLFG